MKKTMLTAAAAMAALAMPAAAHAGSPDGKIQLKLLATGVLPDGKVTAVTNDVAGLVGTKAVTNTAANDNVVPTLAVEYFVTPNISVETICCTTAHHVTVSAGTLNGTVAVDNVVIIPATVTLKYHLPLGPIKPYVGAGPTWFIMAGNGEPSAAVKTLGVTSVNLSSELGVAVQAGVDIALGNSGYSISLDAKKYWVKTDAKFYAGAAEVLGTTHKLDPWVLSGGVAYRF